MTTPQPSLNNLDAQQAVERMQPGVVHVQREIVRRSEVGATYEFENDIQLSGDVGEGLINALAADEQLNPADRVRAFTDCVIILLAAISSAITSEKGGAS